MIARLFDNPAVLLGLIVLGVVLFGGKRLPDAARGLGRSMRILKSEVRDMKEEDRAASPSSHSQQAISSTDRTSADRAVHHADRSSAVAEPAEPRSEH